MLDNVMLFTYIGRKSFYLKDFRILLHMPTPAA